MNELLNISVAMFAGLMLTRLGNKLRLPDVTAYLVAGVLIGPCVIGALHIPGVGFSSFEELDALGAISDVALGFIAFSIGNEFRLSQLRETGKQALVIGVLQAVVTTLIVDAALLGLHLLFPSEMAILPLFRFLTAQSCITGMGSPLLKEAPLLRWGALPISSAHRLGLSGSQNLNVYMLSP